MAQRPLDADDELRQAAKTVDEQLASEQKYPELGAFFTTDFSSAYIAPESRQQVLRRKRAISLPDNLFEQYNRTTFFMTRVFEHSTRSFY